MQLISTAWGPLDASQALQGLSDTNPDFSVIGICSTEYHSNKSSTVAGTLAAMLGGQKQQHATSAHSEQPHGLQIHVNPADRVIVLDASAILSPAILTVLLSPDRPQPAVGSAAAAAVRAAASRAGSSSSIPVEGVAALLGLQMIVFLLAVCNLVLVCSSDFDTHLLQLLEAAGYIATSIPDPTLLTAAAAQQQAMPKGRGSSARVRMQQQQQQRLPYHVADLLLVHCCKQQQQHLEVQQLQQLTAACFRSTVWARRPSVIPSGCGAAVAADATRPLPPPSQQQQEQASRGVAIWTVPEITEMPVAAAAAAANKQQQQRVPQQLQQLINYLLCIPRIVSQVSSSSSSSSSSSNGCFGRAVSEREWLRGAERVWSAVQDSSELLQYYSTAAVARYAGSGGWRQR